MKNIYKIKLFLITLLVFSSCAINDDEPVTNLIATTTVSLDNAMERTTPGATSYDLVANVTGTIPHTSRLTYTVDGVEMYVDGNPNATTITIPVEMTNVVRVVKLVSITSLYSTAEGYQVNVSDSNNTTAVVDGGTGTNGDMFVQLNWDTGADIDLMMTEAPAPTAPFLPTPANIVSYSGSITQGESFTVPAATAAGDYSISIIPWDTFSSPINFTLLVVEGNNAYNFTGTVDSAAVGGSGGFFTPLTYGTVVEFVMATKAGTGAASTYTLVNKL